MTLVIATAVSWIALLVALGAVFGWWIVGAAAAFSIVGGGPLIFLAWWWAHTYPEHGWRRPGEPGAVGLLIERLRR